MKKIIFIAGFLIFLSAIYSEELIDNFLVKLPNSATPALDSFDEFILDSEMRNIERSAVEKLFSFDGFTWYNVKTKTKFNAKILDEITERSNNFTVQLNNLSQLYALPNDPYYNIQQFDLVDYPLAWDITTGAEHVLIAVIDSGLYFDHPDLKNSFYINENEIPDNGIDDDQNGFVDDWRGWDFVDAPELYNIGVGDFIERDNDPSDENSHGTQVGGIIAAEANNGIGICGSNWNAKILTIRAGFKTNQFFGYLQDDDAASAVIYAADMGADVVNLSWGDSKYSPVIADACEYAKAKGSILVAAAGNNGAEMISYPARLSSTISVGSVRSDYTIAGFSNFGENLDLVAPGQSIISTYSLEEGNLYSESSGTSISAPFVTGAIALLLSVNPNLNFSQVKSRLEESCRDLGDPGRDDFYGFGLLNVNDLISDQANFELSITSPMDYDGLSESFDIYGTATSPHFFRYSIMYSSVLNPSLSDWKDIETHENTPDYHYEPVESGKLGSFNLLPHLPDGEYLIRLELDLKKNDDLYYSLMHVNIDQTPPEIFAERTGISERYDGAVPVYYCHIAADEAVTAKIDIENSESNEIFSAYSSSADSLLTVRLPQFLPAGEYSVSIRLKNSSGLTSDYSFPNTFSFDFANIDIYDNSQNVVDTCMAAVSDQNNSSLIMMKLKNIYNDVYYSEFDDNGNFTLKEKLPFKFYPQDFYSMGNEDFLMGTRYDSLYVWRVVDKNFDTVSDYGFTGENSVVKAHFIQIDDDDYPEIAAIKNLAQARVVNIYDYVGGSYALVYQLVNTTDTYSRNTFTSNVISGDFNGNGRKELIVGDMDGDVICYEFEGGSYNEIWVKRLPLPNNYFLGKTVCEGKEKFVATSFVPNAVNPELSFWVIQLFGYDESEDDFKVEHSLLLDQYESGSSMKMIDFDDDGDQDIVLAASPFLYYIEIDDSNMKPVWVGESARTYSASVIKKGGKLFSFVNINSGEAQFFAQTSEESEFSGPSAPDNFRGEAVSENQINLYWDPVPGMNYRVFRGEDTNQAELIAEVSANKFTDTVNSGKSFYYAVASFNETEGQSRLTYFINLSAGNIPGVVENGVRMTGKREIRIRFTEEMGISANNISCYLLNNGYGNPSSANSSYQQKEIIASFSEDFVPDSDYILTLSGIYSRSGVKMPDKSFPVKYKEDSFPPEVKDLKVEGNTLSVTFNEIMDEESVSNIKNYRCLYPKVDPHNQLLNADYQNDKVKLKFKSKIKVSNEPYKLEIAKLKDSAGNEIALNNRIVDFGLTEISNLNYVEVVPNPLYCNEFEHFRFLNLPLNKAGSIAIYDFSGKLVYKETIAPRTINNNEFTWNAKNKSSQPAASGIYFYVLKFDKDIKKGKIAVIR
ncbi:MAG: hypothetical protein CSB55_02315 [Candidatus Cloacimonadota bacterium]|nr:MAG: hypothetical protein CSB55_02315 [Candidatus Cloacimonadota bacterium]